METFNVHQKLPQDRQRVQWYHNLHHEWYIGTFWATPWKSEPTPMFTDGNITGFVFDGTVTYWAEEPPSPFQEILETLTPGPSGIFNQED